MLNLIKFFIILIMKISGIACLFLLVALTTSLEEHDVAATFCWKDSYGRGVGKIPSTCASNRDRIGLLCYTKCPAKMTRFGFDCHSICPSGWRNDGLFCRLAEYGRGAGYGHNE